MGVPRAEQRPVFEDRQVQGGALGQQGEVHVAAEGAGRDGGVLVGVTRRDRHDPEEGPEWQRDVGPEVGDLCVEVVLEVTHLAVGEHVRQQPRPQGPWEVQVEAVRPGDHATDVDPQGLPRPGTADGDGPGQRVRSHPGGQFIAQAEQVREREVRRYRIPEVGGGLQVHRVTGIDREQGRPVPPDDTDDRRLGGGLQAVDGHRALRAMGWCGWVDAVRRSGPRPAGPAPVGRRADPDS